MPRDYLVEATQRFEQLTELEDRLTSATGLTIDLFEDTRKSLESSLTDICDRQDVKQAVVQHLSGLLQAKTELDYLGGLDKVNKQQLAARRQALGESLVGPEFGLARRFMSETVAREVGPWELFDLDSKPASSPEEISFDGFFEQPVNEVAAQLIGKSLVVGRRRVEIQKVKAQDKKENQKHLKRPLFGPNRVGVYVPSVYGKPMLFIAAGNTSSCVRIEQASRQGQVFKTSSQICSALEIPSSSVGDRTFDGKTLKITDLKPVQSS